MTIRILGANDAAVLDAVAPGVFDRPVDPQLAAEFLRSPSHHLAVALAEETVVGFASGLHYLHPDKPPELWINEVGVAPPHRGKGLGRRLLEALLTAGREAGCREAWVLTDQDNEPAMRLYGTLGGRRSTAVMYSIPIPS